MHQSIFYWKAVHVGAAEAARDLHVNVKWQGPLTADAREPQLNITEDLLTGSQALVLAPVDNKALVGPVDDYYNKRIPVIIIDSALESDKPLGFIGTDNYGAGKLAADYMAQQLKGQGKVAVLRGVEGTASTDAREKGFLDEMAAKYPGVQIVSKNVRGGGNSETAQAAGENILAPLKKANGYDLDGVFCSMESLTFGMMLALDNAGLTGKVKLVGFDFSDQLINGIENGHITALITQDPRQLGYRGVKAAVDAYHGIKPDKVYYIPPVIVTKANLHDPTVWARVKPDLSILGQ